ncbi:hypothetical protein PFFCH_01027 [Plasmodium falciparum FCH/4]|uniref:Uncharacterized protein n=1 Tax=Plasmodium falciparum FCH/4 TaxID=1036724 RepID=A0A024VTA2_PLAFA|nr:hypothetical protein PFFCH_01027 [Plasmodium falciparum FCH/4]
MLTNCKNILHAYIIKNDNEFVLNKNVICWNSDLIYHHMCNISSVLLNYFFILYTYIQSVGNKRDEENININVNVFMYIIRKINYVLKFYIYSKNVSNKYYNIKKEVPFQYNKKDEEDYYYFNHMFVKKNRRLEKNVFLLSLNILKNRWFLILLKYFMHKYATYANVFEEFLYLYLCFLNKNMNTFFGIVQKRKKTKLLLRNLMINIIMGIVLHDIVEHEGVEVFKKKVCYITLCILKRLNEDENFIRSYLNQYNHLFKSETDVNIIINDDKDASFYCTCFFCNGKCNFLMCEEDNRYVVQKNENIIFEQFVLYYIFKMRNEKLKRKNSKKYIYDDHKREENLRSSSNIPVLINLIMDIRHINDNVKILLNKLCSLYIRKCYNNNYIMNKDIIKKIIMERLSDKNNDIFVFTKRIKDDYIYLLEHKDIENDMYVFFMYNFLNTVDIKFLNNEKENINKDHYFVILFLLYLIRNKKISSIENEVNYVPIFKEYPTLWLLLNNIEYEQIYYLKKEVFNKSFAEKCLDNIICAYKNARQKNKLSFLLLVTIHFKNKICLFIALSILFYVGDMLNESKEKRKSMLKKYEDISFIRRICKVLFFYFYGYIFKYDKYQSLNNCQKNVEENNNLNRCPNDEYIFKSYENITLFLFKRLFKCFLRYEGLVNNVSEKKINEYEHIKNVEIDKKPNMKILTKNDNNNNNNIMCSNSDADEEGYKNINMMRGSNIDVSNYVEDSNKIKQNEYFIKYMSKRRNDYHMLLLLLLNLVNKKIENDNDDNNDDNNDNNNDNNND